MDIIVAIFITAVVFGILGSILGRRRQRWFENVGESAVRRYLLRSFPNSEYHLMNNITLPIEDGTTQVDHILVSRYGIFVIETKHYTGWIFGDEKSKIWTQVIYNFKSKFQNPIRQNYKHILSISKILDFIPQDNIHSIVVFTGDARFKTKCPRGVVGIHDLSNYIRQFEEVVLSENRMQFCVGRIETIRKSISRKTDIEHQRYLVSRQYIKRYKK